MRAQARRRGSAGLHMGTGPSLPRRALGVATYGAARYARACVSSKTRSRCSKQERDAVEWMSGRASECLSLFYCTAGSGLVLLFLLLLGGASRNRDRDRDGTVPLPTCISWHQPLSLHLQSASRNAGADVMDREASKYPHSIGEHHNITHRIRPSPAPAHGAESGRDCGRSRSRSPRPRATKSMSSASFHRFSA